jgi:hypothetical protein
VALITKRHATARTCRGHYAKLCNTSVNARDLPPRLQSVRSRRSRLWRAGAACCRGSPSTKRGHHPLGHRARWNRGEISTGWRHEPTPWRDVMHQFDTHSAFSTSDGSWLALSPSGLVDLETAASYEVTLWSDSAAATRRAPPATIRPELPAVARGSAPQPVPPQRPVRVARPHDRGARPPRRAAAPMPLRAAAAGGSRAPR